ncbi:MAG: hypothetical protein VB111_04500 [Clostridiaceae bacterium]|nr:hypothetical protein [Clostridiaceae bacterium]
MYHYSIAPDLIPALSDKLALARTLCVTNLELPGTLDGIPFDKLSPAALEAARETLIDSGVRVVLATISADPADDDAIRRFFNAAYTLHVESVLLPVPVTDDIGAYIAGFTPAARYAQCYGMGLLVSNDPASFLSTDAGVTQIVHAFDAYDCGAVFDTVGYQKTGVYPFFGACYGSHIKNRIRVLRMGDLYTDGTPAPLNHGVCGLREVTSLLLARSFDGYFSIRQDASVTAADDWAVLLHDTRQMLKNM